MKTHELKTDPAPFYATAEGIKKWEIRKDDRNFNVGDTLLLRETLHSDDDMKKGAPLEYTGRYRVKTVKYILRGPIYGLEDGWVIMSVE